MAFADIPGNEKVKKILRAFLQRERLPHALIFAGPKGVGKKLMALNLAKALNCQKDSLEPCEHCTQCNTINKESHPDIIIISPEGQFLKIDQMRFLIHTAYLKPMVGSKRVFIITQAEKLNDESANALLKILEEPPPFSLIILITENPFFLLPTIRSRCQMIPFSSISKEQIESILKEKGYDSNKARLISLLAEGNLEKALSLDWEEVQDKKQGAWRIFRNLIMRKNLFETYQKMNQFGSLPKNSPELCDFLEFLTSFCRDLILLKEGGEINYLLNPDLLKEFNEVKNQISLDELQNYLEEIENCIYYLEKNVKIKILINYIFSKFAFGKEGKNA